MASKVFRHWLGLANTFHYESGHFVLDYHVGKVLESTLKVNTLGNNTRALLQAAPEYIG